jgi:primosomal protein N' (replication factor Y)
MSEAWFAPLGACVNLMIPVGFSRRADIVASLTPQVGFDESALKPLQKRLLKLLKDRGPLRGRQLDRAFGEIEWRGSLEGLRSTGLVRTGNVLPPPGIAPKTLRTAALSLPPAAVEALTLEQLGKNETTQQRRKKVLELLSREAFPIDFSWIYAETGASYADLKVLAEAGLLHFNETEVWRDPLEEIQVKPDVIPVLTHDQEMVWQQIQPGLGQPNQNPYLLHGVTGSGKTEIYLRAAAEVLAQGRQVLMLVPEIAMTPQTVRRFMARFPNQVGLYHSKLSDGERYDTWRRARSGELKLIVGSRSALFVPLPHLGLIAIDECDHDSYDETEREPFYHAVETAEALAKLSGANLILGSATPRVTQYFNALRGEFKLLRLPNRILAHRAEVSQPGKTELLTLELPKVNVVDMRAELRAGNSSVLSKTLRDKLALTLQSGQQAILFLNRRGNATYVFCRQCGFTLRCPRDDQPLVYHNARQGLICHLCDYTRQMPKKCPQCGSTQIRQLGLGTERLEEVVQKEFPNARLLRWDADTTRHKGEHELILSHFSAHRADVLIGTQMLAKGLDLPLVTLVGIVLAEVGLNLPDYRAAERSFQVLTQVAGRAGRSPLGGQVVLQTYQPDNYVIQAASKHDFESFYLQELEARKALNYPPYSGLIRLEYRHSNESKAQNQALTMADLLRAEIYARKMTQTDFIGPVPAYYRKVGGQFRWQIILRGPNPLPLLESLPLRGWQVQIEPSDLL